MGLLGGLFGGSKDRRPTATDRCMECGMAGGAHTDWCPAAAEDAVDPEASRDAAGSSPPQDEAAPPT